jgi:hypothetical protein
MLNTVAGIVEGYSNVITGSMEDLARARMAVCNKCEFKWKHIKVCGKCHCPLKGLTRQNKKVCEKWQAIPTH